MDTQDQVKVHPFIPTHTHRPERVSRTSGTSRQNRTKRTASLGRQTALSDRASHPLLGRPLANPDFQQPYARVHRQSAQSTRPCAAPQHEQHPTQLRTQAEPSQPEPEETRVCLRRMGLRERTDMDAHVGDTAELKANGHRNEPPAQMPCAGPDPRERDTLRADGRTGYCATDAARRTTLRAVTSGASRDEWSNYNRSQSTSDDGTTTASVLGRSLAMNDESSPA
ncbi:hypothetical protein DFP72DRAFT_1171448 [Ephemerocybe angulata]|uniref:Uncharacterized protein n=1 Tax=Ephemerocybe angulata TaxID=980116 RepID=A0A8H6HUC5_9AGAR|nr:hypothetical protein DFP72DRAFT_1171448 [Tulosesus angulatus]